MNARILELVVYISMCKRINNNILYPICTNIPKVYLYNNTVQEGLVHIKIPFNLYRFVIDLRARNVKFVISYNRS